MQSPWMSFSTSAITASTRLLPEPVGPDTVMVMMGFGAFVIALSSSGEFPSILHAGIYRHY